MLLQLEDLKQEHFDSTITYKAAVPHPNKHLLFLINFPLKILTGHLQDHQPHSSTALNLNLALKSEATIKTHRLHKAKNHMDDVALHPTPGGSHTTTSSSDIRITDNMNMHPTNSPLTAVYFPN